MKAKFQDLISSSDLSGDDKEMWEAILSFVTDQEVQVFSDFIGEGDDQMKKLYFLTRNINLKAKAFTGKNSSEYEKILNTERDDLRAL